MNPTKLFRSLSLRALTVVVGAAMLVGCGGGEEISEIDELEALPEREQLSEVELGFFNVPIPGATYDELQRVVIRNHLQLRFTLHCLVEPDNASEVARLAERRRGDLRDRVIRVCRHTSAGELKDPDLLTLKLRLADAAEPVFEGLSIDHLLLGDVMIEAL